MPFDRTQADGSARFNVVLVEVERGQEYRRTLARGLSVSQARTFVEGERRRGRDARMISEQTGRPILTTRYRKRA